MSLGTHVAAARRAPSADGARGADRARRSSSSASSGGVARRSIDSRAPASMRSSTASTSRLAWMRGSASSTQPRQLGQDAPLLLGDLELGELEPVVEIDDLLGLDEHRLPRLRRAVHDAAHCERASMRTGQHVAILALREEAILQVRRDVRARRAACSSLRSSSSRIALRAAAQPAQRRRGAIGEPHRRRRRPRSCRRSAPETSSRSVMQRARARAGAAPARCATRWRRTRAPARQRRARRRAARCGSSAPPLPDALQRLVDVAHAVAERQRLAGVAQRARLGRPPRGARARRRARSSSGSAAPAPPARGLRAPRELVEQPCQPRSAAVLRRDHRAQC